MLSLVELEDGDYIGYGDGEYVFIFSGMVHIGYYSELDRVEWFGGELVWDVHRSEWMVVEGMLEVFEGRVWLVRTVGRGDWQEGVGPSVSNLEELLLSGAGWGL